MHNFLFTRRKNVAKKAILFSFILYVFCVPKGNAVEIVVNQSVPVQEISLNKVRAIFTMRQRFWSSGEQIKVFTLADVNPIHKTFSKNKLQMFPHQLRRVWDRLVFSGTGQAPVTLDDEQQMLDKIANTPHSIGYLNSEQENEKIRTIVSQ